MRTALSTTKKRPSVSLVVMANLQRQKKHREVLMAIQDHLIDHPNLEVLFTDSKQETRIQDVIKKATGDFVFVMDERAPVDLSEIGRFIRRFELDPKTDILLGTFLGRIERIRKYLPRRLGRLLSSFVSSFMSTFTKRWAFGAFRKNRVDTLLEAEPLNLTRSNVTLLRRAKAHGLQVREVSALRIAKTKFRRAA